jgi:hypothetical protein
MFGVQMEMNGAKLEMTGASLELTGTKFEGCALKIGEFGIWNLRTDLYIGKPEDLSENQKTEIEIWHNTGKWP